MRRHLQVNKEVLALEGPTGLINLMVLMAIPLDHTLNKNTREELDHNLTHISSLNAKISNNSKNKSSIINIERHIMILVVDKKVIHITEQRTEKNTMKNMEAISLMSFSKNNKKK